MAEDHLHQHFRYYMVMPASLIIEGVAQAAGMLLFQSSNYSTRVILGKLPKFIFHKLEARPGDILRYAVKIEMMREDGAAVTASVHIGDELMAEGELFFAFLNNERFGDQSLFQEGDLTEMLRQFCAFKVGVDADGNKLKDPDVCDFRN